MPTLEPVYLIFRTGLHIGRHGIGQEETLISIPSDTLFAALAAARLQLATDLPQWINGFQQNPPFRLTSAFPYAGKVRFYPRPLTTIPGIKPKTWRKIRYISEAILKRWLDQSLDESLLPKTDARDISGGLVLQNGTLWMSAEEVPALPEHLRTRQSRSTKRPEHLELWAIQRRNVWKEATTPRVLVDRITQRSEIYHVARVSFQQGCGLWFGVEWRDPASRHETLTILEALADSGLGAERSAGYGAFSFETGEPLSLPDPHPGKMMLLLSRYYPKNGEAQNILSRQAAYELVYVAGRVQSLGQANQRRRGVQLVSEGSLIDGAAQGDLVDVKPLVGNFPHQVWRYGLALGLEVK